MLLLVLSSSPKASRTIILNRSQRLIMKPPKIAKTIWQNNFTYFPALHSVASLDAETEALNQQMVAIQFESTEFSGGSFSQYLFLAQSRKFEKNLPALSFDAESGRKVPRYCSGLRAT